MKCTFLKLILLSAICVNLSCCFDITNNFKEIDPKNLKYTSKTFIIKINCGSLYELYVDEGAFGGHEDYLFESINGKAYFLSSAYLHNTNQLSIFSPVDSSIVYFDGSKQIWPTGDLKTRNYWFKKSAGHITPIDSMLVDTFMYVEKLYKLNDKNQLSPYLDLYDNKFSWSFDDGIYFMGYPGVFYHEKLYLCELK